jgi:hypothetical protein
MRCPTSMRKVTICCFVFGVLLFFFGALFFGGAWLVRYELVEYINHSVEKQIVVDSFDAPGYKKWVTNFDPSQPPLIQAFTMYNITNLHDVQNGALPIVQEVGPYTYQQKRLNIDVNFTESGTKVYYNTWTRFEFRPELSNGTEEDVVYNINPAYMGALSFAGRELNLVIGATGPSIKLFFDFLWGTFTQDFVAQSVPDILNDAKAVLSKSVGTNEFFSIWANATKAPPTGDWQGMLVSLNQTQSSEVSLKSAQALFNRSIPNSLVAWDRNSTTKWRTAIYGGPNNVASTELREQFSLTQTQMDLLLQWLNTSFVPTLVVPNITVLWNVSDLSDLAFIQWGEATLTQGVSVTQLYPGLPFPQNFELPTFWRNFNKFNSMDIWTSKMLWAGPLGLFETPNVAVFFAAIESLDLQTLQKNWGLNVDDLVAFVPYFGYMAQEWGSVQMNNIIARGGGLFTNRTIHQWLWYVDDPLLGFIMPSAANTALVGNETTPDAARARHGLNLCYTGKHDIQAIGDYIEWAGEAEVSGVYAYRMPVSGTNNMGQFQPHISQDTVLDTWDANYIRKIVLIPTDYVSYKGVKMLRYLLSNDTWAINPDLYQSIVGFANMTGAHNGSWVFLSNPHMYGADPTYTSKIQGQTQNPESDITVIDIEPITGAVTNYYEALQINAFLDPAKKRMCDLYNEKVQWDVMYPIVWVKEYATLTDKDADDLKNYLYFGISLEDIMFYVCIAIGAFLLPFSIGVGLYTVWRWRRERIEYVRAYSPVNINSDDLNVYD